MSFFWLMAVVVFLGGAAVGSFLNVLIYRTLHGKNWVKGRSQCEHCGRRIPWHENIPLLSYFLLRGKCSECRKAIDPIHPVVELLTGIVFVWWYVAGSLFFRLTTAPLQFIQPAFWLLIGVVFIAIWVSDIKHLIIPRWAVVVLTGATLFYRLLLVRSGVMPIADLWSSLGWAVGLTACFFGLWWFTRGKGLGFGDVQLVFPLGLILSTGPRVVVGIFAAFVIGAVVGLTLVGLGRKKFRQAVPFGPFLLLGTVIGLLWGYELWGAYVKMIGG